VGSLFLSLTLLATGLSVGSWSYEKMREVILAQQVFSKGAAAAAGTTAASAAATATATVLKIPSWPALALAAFSIASKEWLFQITKRVGDALNSQILVANAWHHRSDAFSSILSLASIAAAMAVPGLLVADSAAGILVAGMICTTGCEILFEAVKQLTDTSDKSLANKVCEYIYETTLICILTG
jgi:divalent metal cation (Fe/Co/Zn/Cd) transporter